MSKRRKKINQSLINQSLVEQESKSLWNKVLSFIRDHSGKIFIGILIITSGMLILRRNTSAGQASSDLLLPERTAEDIKSYFPEIFGPPECDGLLVYHANPPSNDLNSYKVILGGSQHKSNGNSEGEDKITRCVNALADEGDSVISEYEEQGKSVDCSLLGLTKQGLDCQGWELSQKTEIFGMKGMVKEFELTILEDIVKASEYGQTEFLKYVNKLISNGDKDFLTKRKYSDSEFFKEYEQNPKAMFDNVYSNLAFSILERMNKGESLGLVLTDLIDNRYAPYRAEKKKALNNIESDFFLRNKSLATQIQNKLAQKKLSDRSKVHKDSKLFALAGIGHFAYNKQTQNIYIQKGLAELYNVLDDLADENPYAVLLHEHSSFDSSRSSRVKGRMSAR